MSGGRKVCALVANASVSMLSSSCGEKKGGFVGMTFYPECMDLRMLLYVRDGKSFNLGDVSVCFFLVKHTYAFILACGIDGRFVVTYMLYERGAETIEFSYDSENCKGGDVTTYLSLGWADIFNTAVSGYKTLNKDFIIKLSNTPTLEALRVQDRTITGRSDFCERVNLLKTLRRDWAWTNDAFEVKREKFILLPPRASKINFSNGGVDDLYGVTALDGGAVAFDEHFGVNSRFAKQ
jgi:hypothetical protein